MNPFIYLFKKCAKDRNKGLNNLIFIFTELTIRGCRQGNKQYKEACYRPKQGAVSVQRRGIQLSLRGWCYERR